VTKEAGLFPRRAGLNMNDLEKRYQLYCTLFRLDLDPKSCLRIHSAIWRDTENPWRAIGITQKALDNYAANDFKKIKGINRSHLYKRNETIHIVFKRANVLTFKKWAEICTKRDTTIIATSSENVRDDYSKIHYFKSKVQYFPTNFVGFKFRTKVEGVFLKNLWAKVKKSRKSKRRGESTVSHQELTDSLMRDDLN
jgi:hypothetical protein